MEAFHSGLSFIMFTVKLFGTTVVFLQQMLAPLRLKCAAENARHQCSMLHQPSVYSTLKPSLPTVVLLFITNHTETLLCCIGLSEGEGLLHL